MGQVNPNQLIAQLLVIFFAIGLHEYAHCKVADLAGDPTPGIYGRVTLNLFKHFDPMGTIMIIITSLSGFGIGWGKPAPMDPRKMHNPRWDFFAAVAAGPLCNVLQAIVYAMLLRYLLRSGASADMPFLTMFAVFGTLINLSLCFFNLIPLGPLDGHWLIGQLLPEKMRYYYYKWNAGAGTIIMIALVLGSQVLRSSLGFSPIGVLVYTPASAVFHMLTGVNV